MNKYLQRKSNLVDWRSQYLSLKEQLNSKNLVRELWEFTLKSIPYVDNTE